MYGIEKVTLTSLAVVFAYASMKPGMVFFFVRRFWEKLLSFLPERVNLYLRKPLFECLTCCSSVYGILFSLNVFSVSVDYLLFLFQVAGLDYLISVIINFFHDKAEEDLPIHHIIEAKEEKAIKPIKKKPTIKNKYGK